MKGRLCIPSIGPTGIYQLKFRCIEHADCRIGNHPKYLTDTQDNRLFNLRVLAHPKPSVCITEGEIDAMTLSSLGYAAVAAPGGSTFRRHHARLFTGYARVYVIGDGDKAGRDFAKSVTNQLNNATKIIFPEGEDVNSLFCTQGAESVKRLIK